MTVYGLKGDWAPGDPQHDDEHNKITTSIAALETQVGTSTGEFQPALVIVRPSRGDITTFQANCRTHGVISSSTNAATVIQAAIDHASNYVSGTGHTGGKVALSAHRYSLSTPILGRAVDTGANPSVWPIVIEGEGGINGAPAGTAAPGGTSLRWVGGSAPGSGGAVLNLGNDCHGYKVKELCIEGNNVATYCGKSAGRGIEWWHVRFRDFLGTTAGRGLWITNGSDTASDRYVQQRAMFCRAEGNAGGVGFYISDGAGGTGATDGRVQDVQTNGCNDGGLYLGKGGWGVIGGHITHNASGGSRPWGMNVQAGWCHVTNVYFDVCHLGPSLLIGNNNFTITNSFFITDKGAANTHDAISAGSSNLVTVMGCTWGGTSGLRNFFRGTGANVSVIGNVGPSDYIGSGITGGPFNGYSAGNFAG